MPRANRRVLPGYLKDVFFTSRVEMEDYFEGDKITCLLCGHKYRQLDPHLKAVHDMTCDDYREKHGIPYTKGLCSSHKSRQESRRMKEYFIQNPSEKDRRVQQVAQNRHLSTVNGQRGKPVFWRLERTKYPVELWFEVGRKVERGQTISEACRGDDMPPQQLLTFALRTYPDFRDFWNKEVAPKRKIGIGENLKATNPNRPFRGPTHS